MKKLTPMQAIRQNCIDCNYDPLDKGHKIEQIESCTIADCSFYYLRPITTKTKKKLQMERVEKMTPFERDAFYLESEKIRKRLDKEN